MVPLMPVNLRRSSKSILLQKINPIVFYRVLGVPSFFHIHWDFRNTLYINIVGINVLLMDFFLTWWREFLIFLTEKVRKRTHFRWIKSYFLIPYINISISLLLIIFIARKKKFGEKNCKNVNVSRILRKL